LRQHHVEPLGLRLDTRATFVERGHLLQVAPVGLHPVECEPLGSLEELRKRHRGVRIGAAGAPLSHVQIHQDRQHPAGGGRDGGEIGDRAWIVGDEADVGAAQEQPPDASEHVRPHHRRRN
jgi:hypothetical protein